MRKLKLQMQITVNGTVAGPNGEMHWLTWNWGDDIKQYVTELTDSMDTILLGRKMAGGFIDYWAGIASNPQDAQYPFAKIMTDTHKVVFSKTLEKSSWEQTDVATGDITEEVNKLKNQDGKDIIVYGGAGLVSSLASANLIDEYHLFVNPIAVSDGLTIFGTPGLQQPLSLISATPFDCGIVALCYKPR